MMTGSNWRLRNNGGRRDLMPSTYQIRRCNTSRYPHLAACFRTEFDDRQSGCQFLKQFN